MQIAVFTGGTSTERSVAIASATPVVAALRQLGHDVTVVDTVTGIIEPSNESTFLAETVGPAPTNLAELRPVEEQTLLHGVLNDERVGSTDLVFLALHGGSGEDGTMQHYLHLAGLPYTGAGPVASSLAMDKDVAKQLFRAAGVQVADWLMVCPDRGIGTSMTGEQVEAQLGLPVVVKPSAQGSTVGLSIVRQSSALDVAIEEALQFDDEVMVEQYIAGRELTVGILGDEALAVGEIIPPGELFDYQSKYAAGVSQEIFPADISPTVAAEVQRLGLLAHNALKITGYSRVDFRMTDAGELYCLEVNTLPGLTSASLLPKSAAAAGVSFTELCSRIVELAGSP